MITAFIKGQNLSVSYPVIVSNSLDYITAQFVFQGLEWQGFDKWAHFKQKEKVYDVNLVDDKITSDKHLNLTAGEWEIYLHGNKGNQRITTDIEKIIVKPTGALNGEPFPEIPLSAAEQIALKADNAEKIAQSVRNDADNGAFDGTDGISPTAKVEQTEVGAKIIISDKNGTTTAEVKNGKDGSGSGEGTFDHSKLTNRDMENQHPISAIEGLQIELNSKQSKGNYLTEESDPTVPAWAKEPEKPTYTAEEVGARPDTWMPTAADVGALPDDTPIPPAYTLPIASETQLGGVKGPAPTAEQTETAGIDENGNIKYKAGGNSEGKWELIEVIAIGYETLYEKPTDWETNFANYFVLDWTSLIKPAREFEWTSGRVFKKITQEPFEDLIRDKEPNGTPYNFTALKMFSHFLPNQGFFSSNTNIYFSKDGISKVGIPVSNFTGNYPKHLSATFEQKHGYYDISGAIGAQGATGDAYEVSDSEQFVSADKGNISKLVYKKWAHVNWVEGESVYIYGVRA